MSSKTFIQWNRFIYNTIVVLIKLVAKFLIPDKEIRIILEESSGVKIKHLQKVHGALMPLKTLIILFKKGLTLFSSSCLPWFLFQKAYCCITPH